MLGVPDAYELPPIPGLGYLKPDPTTMLRFKAAYVSGPPSGRVRVRRDEGGKLQGILPFTISEVQKLDVPVDEPEPEPAPRRQPGDQQSLLDIAVDHMVGHGPAAHQVWLPPLDVPDTLDELMPDLAVDPQLGLVSQRVARRSAASSCRSAPWTGRASSAATRSRSTCPAAPATSPSSAGRAAARAPLLRIVVAGHGADDHAAGVAVLRARLRRRHVRRAGRAAARGRRRHPLRARRGAPDRRRGDRDRGPARGVLPRQRHRLDRDLPDRGGPQGRADDGYGDVFLVIDGWSTLRADFDDLELEIQQLVHPRPHLRPAHRRRDRRWADFRAAMRDLFGTRLELRLGDPMDSEIDRQIAALVPPNRPGRGLVPSKLHFLAALPRIDGDAGADTPRRRRRRPGPAGHGGLDRAGRTQAAAAARADHARRRARPGRRTGHAADAEKGAHPLLVGINEKELAPVSLDPDTEPHLLIFGDGQSGKSSILRGLRPRDHAHPDAAAGAARRRRLPALAARRGARRVPAQLPHLRHPGRSPR